MANIDDDIALAKRLADAAGEVIRPFFRASFESEQKADSSPVTEADRAAEKVIRAILETERPEDGIIGEEFGSIRESASRQWVLDPIDGTISFMGGRAIFGTLIALMQDGWPLLGLIDQPIANERWVGAVGRNTTLNGKPAQVRRCKDLGKASLATSGPHYFSDEQAQQFLMLASQVNTNLIVYGGDCYNYALLASGHIDMVVEAGLKLHDYAALVPVVESAGGQMCDWSGNPLGPDSDGNVIALGDSARLDDVLEALHGTGYEAAD